MRGDLTDAGIKRYLLGLLPEPEAEALEELYFAEPEVLARVRGIEDDLLDDYVAGRLSPDERGPFESRYLASPRLRERVVSARALSLAAGADARAPAAVTARWRRWRAPLALAAGLLIAVALWFRPPRPTQVTMAPAPTTSVAGSEPSPPVPPRAGAAPQPTAPVATHLALTLSPVLLRGEGRPAEARIPPGTETVVLELEGDPALIPESTSRLHAVLDTVEGKPVWSGEARRVADARRPAVRVSTDVPADRLAAGDYLLTLSTGPTPEGTLYRYFFRVLR